MVSSIATSDKAPLASPPPPACQRPCPVHAHPRAPAPVSLKPLWGSEPCTCTLGVSLALDKQRINENSLALFPLARECEKK